jgi:hypothetical protein
MIRGHSIFTVLIGLAIAGGSTSLAQSQRGDVSDVDRRYPPLEIVPSGRRAIGSCFPIAVADCRVHVTAYELISGLNFGDDPIHDPRPNLERQLESRLKEAYPTWTIADASESSNLRIEVVLYRLDDASGAEHWVVRTDWSGSALHSLNAVCVAQRAVYTSDPASEAIEIVNQMQKGPGIIRRLPWETLTN